MLLLTKAGEVLNTRNLGVLLTYVINVSLALPSILSVTKFKKKRPTFHRCNGILESHPGQDYRFTK